MDGGRLLGAGAFGCVFTPPLLCEGEKKQRFGKVGKITMDIVGEQEIYIAERLRKIPMAKHYFLLPEPESCTLASEKEQTDVAIDECYQHFLDRDQEVDTDHMIQIFEPFGGMRNLYRFMDDKLLYTKQFSFVKAMTHLLEGGSTMLIAGVCHFDIHPGNIVIDKKQTFRMLDFGISFAANEITEQTLLMRWKRLRFGFESDAADALIINAESPEITIMNAIKHGGFDAEQATRLTVFGKPAFKDMQKFLGIPMKTSRDELMSFIQTSESMKQRNFTKTWKTYWTGFDSWAIGAILLAILKELMFYKPFLEGEYKTKGAAILSTLRGLLHPNPRKRLDCIEALALFDPGSAWLQRFGQKWLKVREAQRTK